MISKNKDRIRYYAELALIATIALELLFLIYANIFRLSDVIDVDFARVLRHVAEMGDKRMLFLPHWNYITTAELDHSAIFAIPIYIITGNIMLSYAIANLINIALWCAVLIRLLRLSGMSRICRLTAAAMILTLYDFGMLYYTNMLFIGAQHYTHKVLIPLIFITLILTPSGKGRNVGIISLAVLYYALLLITAVSSGIYVFICGIFPVIVLLIIDWLIKGLNKETIRRIILSATSVIVTMAGIIICKLNDVSPNSELAVIKSMPEIRQNLFSTFLDLTEMFRVFPVKSTPVMSLSTVMSIVRLFIFVIVLVFGLQSVGKTIATEHSEGLKISDIGAEQLLISVFVWNYFILFISGSQQRYHLMGAIPLMICAAIGIGRFLDKKDEMGINTLLFGLIVAALLILNLYQIFWGSRQYFHREDYSKAVNGAIISYMEDNDVDTAFSVCETGYGTEWLRIADTTRSYETYVPETGEIVNHDFYHSAKDRSAYSDRNVLIAIGSDFDKCPEYIKNNYVLNGEAYDYGLYISETNPIDGIAGPLTGLEAIDLVTAPGYEVKGDIDVKGHLTTTEVGEILSSPVFYNEESCVWSMDYSADPGVNFMVELYDGDELTDRFKLSSEDKLADYILNPGRSYKIVIIKEDKGSLYIGDMRFTPMK